MTAAPADPRPLLVTSLDQVEEQISAVADLTAPTPCAAYDVRTLVAHLVAVLRKLTLVRSGGDMTTVPDPAEDLEGAALDAWRQARDGFTAAWMSAPDSVLDREHVLAWGTMTGRDLLDAYTHEFTVHAWDLAQVTGAGGLDPALAEAALVWFAGNVGPEDRAAGGPFGPVVPVADDADPYTRLAGFVGRAV